MSKSGIGTWRGRFVSERIKDKRRGRNARRLSLEPLFLEDRTLLATMLWDSSVGATVTLPATGSTRQTRVMTTSGWAGNAPRVVCQLRFTTTIRRSTPPSAERQNGRSHAGACERGK